MTSAGPEIAARVRAGEKVALVTDAGMPGISDPGEALVALFIDEELPFEVIPGVTAFSTALVGSGLSTSQFVFEGFLSRDKRQKRKHVTRLKDEWRTLIFYEAPHRLKETLGILNDILGPRKAVVARELTKRYEEYRRGSLQELHTYYSEHAAKGEMVVLIEGISQEAHQALIEEAQIGYPEDLYEHYRTLCEAGMDSKAAMKRVAVIRGVKRSEVYAAIVAEKESKL